jgi:hypothetical protein
MSGTYTAQSSGTLKVTLDNKGSSEATSVFYSFSVWNYFFTFNRNGVLVAIPDAKADDEEDDDGVPKETRMDLSDVEDDMITKIDDTGLAIELPPRRRDEPPRLEGTQILHCGDVGAAWEWENQLRTVLDAQREARLVATKTMQACSRVGFAKRVVAQKRGDKLFHEHRESIRPVVKRSPACRSFLSVHTLLCRINAGRRRGATRAVGATQDKYSTWSKPHGKLKLENKPIFHTFENATLTDVDLAGGQGGVGHFFESGVWWQDPPMAIHAKSAETYGSHAKRSGASNSGCVMYSSKTVRGACVPVSQDTLCLSLRLDAGRYRASILLARNR